MSLSESPDNTVVTSSTDPPIVDALGNVYRLSGGLPHVIVNGAIDVSPHGHPPPVAEKLAYCGRRVWCLDTNGNWRSKRHPGDDWSPPGKRSPLPVELIACIEERLEQIEREQTIIVDNEVAQSKDIEATAKTIQELQVAFSMLAQTVNKILAIVGSSAPTKIVLDVAGASIASQPVPEKPGP